MNLLEKMVQDEFRQENVQRTKEIVEARFGEKAYNLRDYFEMLDARVAEYKQLGGHEEMANMQRQECFILANNFVGDDLPGKVYLSRMVIPFS
jgi:hypothetical protein